MTRLNVSFIATFLVLATCAMSLPTKRDEGHGFGLAKALSGLEKLPKIMEGLDNKNTNDQHNEAAQPPAADNTKAEEQKPAATEQEEKPAGAGQAEKKVAQEETPTATEKKPYSGNFATPTATHTHKPTSKPNALGALPVVGGLLGGTGGPL